MLLCDLMMPCLDGYSLMRLIRSQEQQSLQRLPVIAVSGRAEAEAQRQALAVGFQNYVTKPINFEAVIDAVLQLQPSAA
jgi:CheY-like chemotaxis protein